MGWTGIYHFEIDNRGNVDRKATLDREFNKWSGKKQSGVEFTTENIKSAMRGNTYYSAMRTAYSDGSIEIWALIIITSVNNSRGYKEFMYKEMSEDMIPGYYDCPVSILNLLTETDNENANIWRENCRKNREKKNNSWLRKLPEGGRIIWTRYDGKQYTVVKHPAAYQFKTWFWYCPETGKYIKKSLITENNAIIA